MSTVQFIERDGQAEFAVVPIELWRRVAVHLDAYVDEDMVLDRMRYPARESLRLPEGVLADLEAGVHPVKAWRDQRGLTQEQLAAAASITKPFLSQIENGKRRGSITVLSAISQALSVPIDMLMSDWSVRRHGGALESGERPGSQG